MNLLIVAIIVNSALYIAMVFVAGLVTHNQPAYILAIVTAGICYLAPLVQSHAAWPEPGRSLTAGLLVAISIGVGIAAGLALIL